MSASFLLTPDVGALTSKLGKLLTLNDDLLTSSWFNPIL
jgi:hypothetical protein